MAISEKKKLLTPRPTAQGQGDYLTAFFVKKYSWTSLLFPKVPFHAFARNASLKREKLSSVDII